TPADVRGAQSGTAPVQRRDALSPQQVKEWTELPPHISLPPMPPLITPAPTPGKPEIVWTPIPQPGKPEIIWTPIPPPAKPLIIERRVKRWNDNEPWQKHHHIPRALWQYGRSNRMPFSPKAVELFEEETVEIPEDEHWSDLHDAYNEVARKGMLDYLETYK